MVAHARADPADAGCLGLLDGELGGASHHQMAHAVVAVDQRRRRPVADDADVRLGIDAAGADAADIERQPDDAMGIAAAQVGLDHERRRAFRRPRPAGPPATKARATKAASRSAGMRGSLVLMVWTCSRSAPPTLQEETGLTPRRAIKSSQLGEVSRHEHNDCRKNRNADACFGTYPQTQALKSGQIKSDRVTLQLHRGQSDLQGVPA